MKRSVASFAPVSPVRPYVLAALVVEPGRGARRRPAGPIVVASPPTFGFSPNQSGVWL